MRFQIPQAPHPFYPCFRKCQKSSTIVTAKGQQLRETIFRGNAPPPSPIVTIQRLTVEFCQFFDRKILIGGSKENELENHDF